MGNLLSSTFSFKSRSLKIDALRGLSIVLVLLTHGILPTGMLFVLGERQQVVFAANGYLGVTIFFVISGFLIMQKTMNGSGELEGIRDFYLSRITRIFPLLFLFSIFCILANVFLSPTISYFKTDNGLGSIYEAIANSLRFSYNTFYSNGASGLPGLLHMAQLWSLSIEELFYLGFPIVIFLVKKNEFVILFISIICIFQAPLSRLEHGIYSLSGVVDGICFGILAALASSKLKKNYWQISMLTCFALILSLISIKIQDHMILAPSIIGMLSAILLATFKPGAGQSKLRYPLIPLAILGKLSFEIYLFHFLIFAIAMDQLKPLPYWSAIWIQVGIQFAVAVALNAFFANPIRANLQKLFKKFV